METVLKRSDAGRCRKNLILHNLHGLHVRAASLLAKTAQAFGSQIRINFGGRCADAKSLLELLALGAVPMAEVSVTAMGSDAELAMGAMEHLFKNAFGEEEFSSAARSRRNGEQAGGESRPETGNCCITHAIPAGSCL